jgi:hypothetical protein
MPHLYYTYDEFEVVIRAVARAALLGARIQFTMIARFWQ